MKKIWPFSFYFLYFAAIASLMPFIVIFYQRLGFTGTEIGLLTGLPPLITLFFAPLGAGLADSTHRHKLIMGLGLAVVIGVAILLPGLTSFAAVFALIMLFNIFLSPIGSLSDSATMSMLGEQRSMYGRIRLGGTIGWGIFAPIAGFLVQGQGLRIAFWMFAGILFIALLVSQRFSFGAKDEHQQDRGGIRVLLTSRRWIFFLMAAFLAGLGVFSVAAYLYPYMAELGATESQMGTGLLIATLTELPIFFFGNRLIKRFSAYGLFMIALVLIGVRSLLYFAASSTYMVWAVQVFSGMVFPAMWLAGVSYADENAPEGLKSTAQGLLGAMVFGFGAAVSGFLGGVLLENIGGRNMFLVFGIIILAGLMLIEGVNRLFPERELTQPEIS